jgi:hypothetical protein
MLARASRGGELQPLSPSAQADDDSTHRPSIDNRRLRLLDARLRGHDKNS